VPGVVSVSKKRISATLEDDVYQFVQQEHINTSGLINRCLKEYMNTGGDVSAVRDLRIRQLKDEADELESRADTKRQRAKELRGELEAAKDDEQTAELDAVLQRAEYIPPDPEHPFVQENATELGIEPTDLADEIADKYGKTRTDSDDDTDLNSL